MSKPTPPPSDAPVPEVPVSVTYVGPEGHESPTFGPLVAGRRYQIQADLAAYLCATHPDFWQAVATTVKE